MLVFFITRCDSWMDKSPGISLFESPIEPYPILPPADTNVRNTLFLHG